MHTAFMLPKVGLLFLALLAAGGLSNQAVAAGAAPAAPVRLDAELACLEAGGAEVTLTIRNLGREALALSGDFHLLLELVQPGGIHSGVVAFVFVGPGSEVVPAGGEQVYGVPLGAAVPGVEPGMDLRAKRLLLEAELWFVGYDQPVHRRFTFPGCPHAPVFVPDPGQDPGDGGPGDDPIDPGPKPTL